VVTGIELYKLHHHTQTQPKVVPDTDLHCFLDAELPVGPPPRNKCVYQCKDLGPLCSHVDPGQRCPDSAPAYTLGPCT
jgi:hypothetical protein